MCSPAIFAYFVSSLFFIVLSWVPAASRSSAAYFLICSEEQITACVVAVIPCYGSTTPDLASIFKAFRCWVGVANVKAAIFSHFDGNGRNSHFTFSSDEGARTDVSILAF